MSIEVDPETNPLLTRVDNPGYDETGEQMEMGNLNQYDSVDPTGLYKNMRKLHLVENKVSKKKMILYDYLSKKKKM